jgi:hypothetical protein
MRYKTGHDPVENARQEKMSFVDTDPHYQDGVPYKVTYKSSGLITAEAPVKPKTVDVHIGQYADWSSNDALDDVYAVNVSEPGDKGWVSYKVSYAFAKPNEDIKIRKIKISPHSKAGKALVKKS